MSDTDEKVHRAAVSLLKWWVGAAGGLVVVVAAAVWAAAAYLGGLARASDVVKVEGRTTVLEVKVESLPRIEGKVDRLLEQHGLCSSCAAPSKKE